MPELPEVETVLRTLLPHLLEKRVTRVRILNTDVIGWPDAPVDFARRLCGRRFTGGDRRGKLLLFKLDDDERLVVHLRMTGKLFWRFGERRRGELPGQKSAGKHVHLILDLDDENELVYADTRRFGRFYLIRPGEEAKAGNLQKLGPEPLTAGFSFCDFSNRLKDRKAPIKSILLNQEVVAGLGNIYVDEILFRSKVHPACKTAALTDEQLKTIFVNIRETLLEAINKRGTTFRDYRDGDEKTGDFQEYLQVYNRERKTCHLCDTIIKREKISGRSSYFCPCCQRMDANGSGNTEGYKKEF